MISDDQVKYCAANPNAGETLTINYLRNFLPNGVLLANYFLPNPPGTLEVDVVVINHNGVYLLEVKHWYGPIKADSMHWRHSSGDLRPSPIPIIAYKASHLHGILKRKGWNRVSTMGLVVLSKGTGALDIDDPNAHKVFGLHESLIKALTGRDYVHNSKCRRLSNKDVATALAHCHSHGVYHRNLSPASVYLIPTGRAKVGDFDFAKVPSISQTLSLATKQLMTGRHLAPEQTVFAPDVDQRADIFALGATWYDMLFRPGPDEFLDRSRIAETPLSKDGREFLEMLVAERRSGRPQSMQDVQDWLALLK